MENRKNKKYDYWPQTALATAAIIMLSAASYFLFNHSKSQKFSENKKSQAEEQRLPGLAFVSYKQKEIDLKDLLTGDKNLLIFWATWCGPCVEEMKEMPKLLPQIKQRGYLPIFVNYDPPENKKTAEDFAKKYGVETAFETSGELLYALGISALPVSLIVDKSGKILKTLRGEIMLSRL